MSKTHFDYSATLGGGGVKHKKERKTKRKEKERKKEKKPAWKIINVRKKEPINSLVFSHLGAVQIDITDSVLHKH